MPIFEFICEECRSPFEELLRSADAVTDVRCPRCGSQQVKKQISTFAARIVGGGTQSLGSRLGSNACSTGSV